MANPPTISVSAMLLLAALCAASPLTEPQLDCPQGIKPKVLTVLRSFLYPELEARGLLPKVRTHALHVRLTHTGPSLYTVNNSHIILQAAAPQHPRQQPHELLRVLGRLLQHLSSGDRRSTTTVLPEDRFVTRSHQLGYYFEGRTPEFAQYARELAVFGANQVEFAHWQWGSNSSVDSLNTYCYGGNVSAQVEWSGILDDLGMNVSVWWPVDIYFQDQGKSMEDLVSKMPRLDSLFVPGGDGGMVLSPADFFSAVEKMAAVVRKHHPGASVWMSAQEYSIANLTAFMSLAADNSWLTGLAYGPHVVVPFAQFDKMVPEGMPVRQYPDITHPESAQYELYQLDPRLVVTHGRTIVSPTPHWFGGIARLRMNASFQAHQAGFGAYSEGISDDLNKAIWSGLYADPSRSVEDIVGDYAAYYTTRGSNPAQSAAIVAELIFALEKTFSGSLEENSNNVMHAVLLANKLQESDPQAMTANWRLQAFVFRALYDGYILLRAQHEDKLIQESLSMLAAEGGAAQGKVSKLLLTSFTGLSATAKKLKNQTVHMAAVVGATLGAPVILQCQVPDLGIPTIDSRISDVPFIQWLAAKDLLEHPEVTSALLNYSDPGPAGFYDQAGSIRADEHPHLDPGQGASTDPSSYFTPIQAVQAPKHASDVGLPFSWFQYAEVYYGNPLQFVYSGLDSKASYAVTVVFHYSDKAKPVRMVADNVVLKDFFVPTSAPVTVNIPGSVTHNQQLKIAFNQPTPVSGSGRGGLVAGVWVHRQETVLGVTVLAEHILSDRA